VQSERPLFISAVKGGYNYYSDPQNKPIYNDGVVYIKCDQVAQLADYVEENYSLVNKAESKEIAAQRLAVANALHANLQRVFATGVESLTTYNFFMDPIQSDITPVAIEQSINLETQKQLLKGIMELAEELEGKQGQNPAFKPYPSYSIQDGALWGDATELFMEMLPVIGGEKPSWRYVSKLNWFNKGPVEEEIARHRVENNP